MAIPIAVNFGFKIFARCAFGHIRLAWKLMREVIALSQLMNVRAGGSGEFRVPL